MTSNHHFTNSQPHLTLEIPLLFDELFDKLVDFEILMHHGAYSFWELVYFKISIIDNKHLYQPMSIINTKVLSIKSISSEYMIKCYEINKVLQKKL